MWHSDWFKKRFGDARIAPEAVPPTGSVPVLPGVSVYSSAAVARILWLESQIDISRKFLAFVDAAYKRGYSVEMFLSVDGQIAPASVMVGPKMKDMLKYIAESAAGWKLKYQTELDFIKGGGNPYAWGRVDNLSRAAEPYYDRSHPDHPDHDLHDPEGE